MIVRIIISICFIFVTLSTSGQNRFLRRGNKAFANKDYPEAITNFHQVKIKDSAVFRKMAVSYFSLKDFDQAEKYYQKILEEQKIYKDLLALSQIQLEHSNFEAAILFCERAKALGAAPNLMDQRIDAIKEIAAGKVKQTKYQREGLDLHPQGKCLGIIQGLKGIIFSDRSSRKIKRNSTYQLFEYDPGDQQKYQQQLYASRLDRTSNIGAACFSSDGKTMYYTRWFQRKGKQQMEIVEAVQRNGDWQAKNLLSFNQRKYSCAYPSLTKDNKIMYFSSNQPGGEGGMDIYMTYRRGKSWSKPMLLGKEINTSGDEIYPRVLKDGTLWFASNGRVGYGKLDLFYASKSPSGNWGAVKNAGFRYNSSGNDYAVMDNYDNQSRLIVSDEEEVNLRDKIYRIDLQEKANIEFVLKDQDSQTPIENVHLSLKNTVTNKEVKAVAQDIAKGEVRFAINNENIDSGILYQIEAKKKGYETLIRIFKPKKEGKQVELFLSEIANPGSFVKKLQPIIYQDKKIIFSNIYFKSNRNQLSDSARIVLKRFVSFWKIYPDLKIRINSHTDAAGSWRSNQRISLLRANKTKAYLIGKGITPENIQIHAYGEEFIINGCSDEVDCPEKKNQENRRVELIFVL